MDERPDVLSWPRGMFAIERTVAVSTAPEYEATRRASKARAGLAMRDAPLAPQRSSPPARYAHGLLCA
jgi:hypothetical protein